MPHDPPDESLLADLLADWESSGGVASAEELCRDRPELLPAVREGMARLRRVNRLIGPLVDDDGTPPTSPLPAGSLPGDLTPGAVLGPFTILGLLGRGGMGAVYLADQQRPKRKVALKLIRGSVGGFGVDAALLKRFEREADVLALLSHPNIARVYEAAVLQTPTGPLPYFAMELVEEGVRLDEYARQRRLSRDDRIRLLIKVCHAVQHAHGKGVIHRDLKPANILVTSEGEPKVLDFGVARVIQTDAVTPEATLTRQTEAIIGTLQYMSPEQASGKSREVDTASDVYALGVIAYQLLSEGRLPYEVSGTSLMDDIRLICDQAPASLSAVDRSLKGDVETVVLKALEKDKARRYATADSLGQDLRCVLDYEPISARRPSTLEILSRLIDREPIICGLFGVLLVFLGALSLFAIYFGVDLDWPRTMRSLAWLLITGFGGASVSLLLRINGDRRSSFAMSVLASSLVPVPIVAAAPWEDDPITIGVLLSTWLAAIVATHSLRTKILPTFRLCLRALETVIAFCAITVLCFVLMRAIIGGVLHRAIFSFK